MSLALVYSRALSGMNAPLVEVEAHLANGLPHFNIVGLPDTEVKESRDRVRAAIIQSGFEFPAKKITVNLAPADLPKESGRSIADCNRHPCRIGAGCTRKAGGIRVCGGIGTVGVVAPRARRVGDGVAGYAGKTCICFA